MGKLKKKKKKEDKGTQGLGNCVSGQRNSIMVMQKDFYTWGTKESGPSA